MHAFDCALASLHVSCLPPAVASLTGLKRRLADRAGSRPRGACTTVPVCDLEPG
jgi:hypothetical protein